jgi:hypothetical protein
MKSVENIRITPNPVKDGFRISGLSDTAQLTILDLYGRQVFSKPIENEEYIPFASQPSGVYVVIVRTGEKTFTEKVLVR